MNKINAGNGQPGSCRAMRGISRRDRVFATTILADRCSPKQTESVMSQQYDPDLDADDILAGAEELPDAEDDIGAPGVNSVEEVQVDFDRLDAGDEVDDESDGSEDNPYLDSDEVLLDDAEEAALGRTLLPPED